MPPAIRPDNEAYRLEVLKRYDLPDSLPDNSLDDIARLAAHICGTSMAYVTLLDEHRQWIKSVVGASVVGTSRDDAFCSYTILQNDVLVVSDARTDERFVDNPAVIGDPHIRFYAGAPLITPEGVALGALCVADRDPRSLSVNQKDALRVLGRQVLAQLDLRRQTRELMATEAAASLAAAMSARAERELRKLFATNPLAMWVYDQKTLQFLEVNEAAIARYGYTREEFLSMTIRDIRPPEDIPRLEKALENGRKTWQTAGHWRHQTKYGYIIDVEITSHAIQFADHAAVMVVAQDVTERLRAEAARRDSEERYRRLFEAAPEGLVVADAARTYIDCNPSACRMLGYTREELIGLNAADIVAPIHAPDLQKTLTHIRASTESFHELQFRRKDGTTFVAEVNATPLPDGTALGIIRDISERIEAGAALREAEERMRYALQSANAASGISISRKAKSHGRTFRKNTTVLRLALFPERSKPSSRCCIPKTKAKFSACFHW